MPERFLVVATADRYDFAIEKALIAEINDIEIEFRTAVCPTEDDLIVAGRDADALLASTRDAITRRLLESLPRCKVIGRYGVGLDNVDLNAAAERGIVVTHFPDYCTAEVADHAMAMILALNRRLVELDRDLRDGAWVKHDVGTRTILRGPVLPLRELTLGLIGCGRIGTAVAKRAAAFGLSLLIADPYVQPAAIRDLSAEPVVLNELLTRSDVVSLHCPLTPETRGLIGSRELALMKPGAFLVNTARGPIVDLDAAIVALSSGALAGAALDVVYPEPLPATSPLYALPNVILTPHAAYYSERSILTVRQETLNETLAVLRGRRPRTVANPAVLERVHLV